MSVSIPFVLVGDLQEPLIRFYIISFPLSNLEERAGGVSRICFHPQICLTKLSVDQSPFSPFFLFHRRTPAVLYTIDMSANISSMLNFWVWLSRFT